MKKSTFRHLKALSRVAVALALTFGVCAARADNFSVTIRVPVNFDHLSPLINAIFTQCTLYDVHGKDLAPYHDFDGWNTHSIDSNVRSFKGVLTHTYTFDQAQAMKIDWGSYTCNVGFVYSDTNYYDHVSVGNPQESHRMLPGAVVQASGSFF